MKVSCKKQNLIEKCTNQYDYQKTDPVRQNNARDSDFSNNSLKKGYFFAKEA